jgi:hypothetical protein
MLPEVRPPGPTRTTFTAPTGPASSGAPERILSTKTSAWTGPSVAQTGGGSGVRLSSHREHLLWSRVHVVYLATVLLHCRDEFGLLATSFEPAFALD